jgi:hypothetical protein
MKRLLLISIAVAALLLLAFAGWVVKSVRRSAAPAYA